MHSCHLINSSFAMACHQSNDSNRTMSSLILRITRHNFCHFISPHAHQKNRQMLLTVAEWRYATQLHRPKIIAIKLFNVKSWKDSRALKQRATSQRSELHHYTNTHANGEKYHFWPERNISLARLWKYEISAKHTTNARARCEYGFLPFGSREVPITFMLCCWTVGIAAFFIFSQPITYGQMNGECVC